MSVFAPRHAGRGPDGAIGQRLAFAKAFRAADARIQPHKDDQLWIRVDHDPPAHAAESDAYEVVQSAEFGGME